MRLGAALVAGAVLAAGILAAIRLQDPRPLVRVDGEAMPVRGEVRFGQVYVDAVALGRALGLRTVYFPDKPLRGVWLQDVERSRFVHLHMGQRDCHVGNETVRLAFPTLYLQRGTNAPMAPVPFVAGTFGATVQERRVAGRVREVLIAQRGRT